MNSSYYGWVGIPLNFFYTSTHDIDRFNLKLRNETINWNSKYGELLEKSMVLTDDEKLFGITKSVMELHNYNYIHRSLVPTFTVFGLYCSTQWINRRFGLFHIPRTVSDERCSKSNFFHLLQLNSQIGSHRDVRTLDNVCIWNLFGGHRYNKNSTNIVGGHEISRTWSR